MLENFKQKMKNTFLSDAQKETISKRNEEAKKTVESLMTGPDGIVRTPEEHKEYIENKDN